MKKNPTKDDRDLKKKISAESATTYTVAGLTAAATAGVTGAVLKTQISPINPDLWNPKFFERDTPINEMPIINAHNAGTDFRQGTLFFNANQDMTTADLLNNTPTRGVEISINKDPTNGQLIINHGADVSPTMIDPSVQPLTLESELGTVSNWLNQPQNQNQVIVIELSNHANGDQDIDKINAIFQQNFGNSVYTSSDLYQDANTKGRWPTIDELTASGKHVIILGRGSTDAMPDVISNNICIHDNFGYPSNFNLPSNMIWNDTWEDRTMIGYLGSATNPEIMGTLNTEQTDKLIDSGGLIKLDQISPNDPRLIDPSQRDKMALDPDVTLFDGTVHINRGVASALIFGAGLGMDTATGSLSLAYMAYQIYSNEQFIKYSKKNMADAMERLDGIEFRKYLEKKNKNTADGTDIIDFQKTLLKNKITRQTLEAGIANSSALAGTIFGMGILFPPILPVVSIISLATAAFGITATGLAAIVNRIRLGRSLDDSSDEEGFKKLKNLSENSATKFNEKNLDSTYRETEPKITSKLLNFILFFRISAMAKYAMPVIGSISSGVMIFLMGIRSIIDIRRNHRNRQKKYNLFPGYLKSLFNDSSKIGKKKYFIFGESTLDGYLKHNYHKILNDASIATFTDEEKKQYENIGPKAFWKDLTDKCPEKLHRIQIHIASEELRESYSRYLEQKKSENSPESVKNFIKDRMKSDISRDIRYSGYTNSFKIALLIVGIGSAFFPPFTAFFLAAAAATLLTGYIVTKAVSRREQNKFEEKINNLYKEIGNPTSSNPDVAAFKLFLNKTITPVLEKSYITEENKKSQEINVTIKNPDPDTMTLNPEIIFHSNPTTHITEETTNSIKSNTSPSPQTDHNKIYKR